MVIKNLENKIKLVTIICSMFLVGCILISISSIWTARSMVVDAQNKIYVLDGNVPILVQRTTMEETLDIEAKSHIERFHHLFFTLAPDDKYIKYLDKQQHTTQGKQEHLLSVPCLIHASRQQKEVCMSWFQLDKKQRVDVIQLSGPPRQTEVFL